MNHRTSILAVFLCLFFQSGFGKILTPVKWKFTSEKIKATEYNLKFTATIDSNWHLYSQYIPSGGPVPTTFHFEKSKAYELIGTVQELSKSETIHDQSFGIDLKLFTHKAVFVQKIRVLSPGSFKIKGMVEFMSCDNHRCLPPRDEDFVFLIGGADASAEAAMSNGSGKMISYAPDSVSGKQKASDSAQITKANPVVTAADHSKTGKKSGSLLGFIFYSFLWGLAGVLTPCVYPMIPMTVSFFMRNEEKQSKGILKGIIFGISIVVIYTLIGLLVSLSIIGSDFGNVLSSHWIPNLIFFLLFFVFALSFFGMFEIVLPSSLVNAVDRNAEKGGLISVFFMALTLIIVSFSCTGPIVGKILIEASQGVSAKPIAGMFGYSLAFALPFTLFALFPSLLKSMPKSGGWLNAVKVVMAFVLLAFSMKFLLAIDTTHHFNILTRPVYLSIWIVLAFLLGFYLLGKIKFAHDSDIPHVGVPRLMLVIVVFSFAVYMIPGLFGAPLKFLASMLPPPAEQATYFQANPATAPIPSGLCETPKYSNFLELPSGLQGYFDYKQGMECARKLNKPVFIDIKGHTCSNCKVMDATVFSDPRVVAKLQKNFVIIALYVDDPYKLPESDWVTSRYDGKVKKTMGAVNLDYEITTFDINAQPLYAVMDTNGKTLNGPYAFNEDVNSFLKFLDVGIKKFQNK